jgi:hypothetical protein
LFIFRGRHSKMFVYDLIIGKGENLRMSNPKNN